VNFFDADGLTDEDCAEIVFFVTHADVPSIGNHDDIVTERIVESLASTNRGLIDLGRTLHNTETSKIENVRKKFD